MLGGNTAGTSYASVTVSSAGKPVDDLLLWQRRILLVQAGSAHRASVLVSNSGIGFWIYPWQERHPPGWTGQQRGGGTFHRWRHHCGNGPSRRRWFSGNLLMQGGGSADRNSVSVSMTGSGTQSIVAGRNDDPSPSANVTLAGRQHRRNHRGLGGSCRRRKLSARLCPGHHRGQGRRRHGRIRRDPQYLGHAGYRGRRSTITDDGSRQIRRTVWS